MDTVARALSAHLLRSLYQAYAAEEAGGSKLFRLRAHLGHNCTQGRGGAGRWSASQPHALLLLLLLLLLPLQNAAHCPAASQPTHLL